MQNMVLWDAEGSSTLVVPNPEKGTGSLQNNRVNLQTPSTESATYRNISYARWTREDSKVKQILTTKSINYEFIWASHIWKTSIIAALIIDVL